MAETRVMIRGGHLYLAVKDYTENQILLCRFNEKKQESYQEYEIAKFNNAIKNG